MDTAADRGPTKKDQQFCVYHSRLNARVHLSKVQGVEINRLIKYSPQFLIQQQHSEAVAEPEPAEAEGEGGRREYRAYHQRVDL